MKINFQIVAVAILLFYCSESWGQAQKFSKDTLKTNTDNVLDEVIVSDTRIPLKRIQSGKPVIYIGQKEIEQFEGRNLSALLTTKSGILLLGNRSITGQNLRAAVRGSGNNQVLILVDGVRMSDPSRIGNDFDLNFLSLNDILSIEILKGGASTLYGSAASAGVINIKTKRSEEKMTVALNAQVGTEKSANQSIDRLSFSSTNFSLSNRKGDLDYRIGLSTHSASGMSAVANGAETDPFFRYNLSAQVGQEKTRFQWRFLASKAEIKNDYDNTFPLEDADFFGFSFLEQIAVNTDYNFRKSKLSARAGVQTTRRDYRDGFPRAYTATNRSFELFHTYQINDQFYSVQGYLYQEGLYEGTPEIHQNDVFANLVYLGNQGLNINAGARWNDHQTYGEQLTYHFNPSYNFSIKDGFFKLLSSVSSAFIAPSLYQLYDVYSGNENLQPELSHSLEFGLQWDQGDVRSGLVFFQRNENPKIIYDLSTYAYANASGNVKVSGVEYTYKNRIVDQIDLDLNYTFTQRNEGVLIRIPKHAVNAHLGYSITEDQQLNLVYAYRGDRQAADQDGTLMKAYSIFDLKYTKAFSPKLRFSGWITNIFNADYEEILGFSTQGRNFRLGLNYQF